jgi:hypothetical protein
MSQSVHSCEINLCASRVRANGCASWLWNYIGGGKLFSGNNSQRTFSLRRFPPFINFEHFPN